MRIPRLLNPFATTRFTLQTSLPVDECVRRLSAQTLTWFQLRGLWGAERLPMAGAVSPSGFRIRRRTSFPRNSYQPIASGEWRERDGRTEISVRVHEDPSVAWLSIAWLLVAMVVATMFVASSVTGRLSSELANVSVPAMLLLPSVGMAAQWYARWLGRDEAERLETFLAEALNGRAAAIAPESEAAESQRVAA